MPRLPTTPKVERSIPSRGAKKAYLPGTHGNFVSPPPLPASSAEHPPIDADPVVTTTVSLFLFLSGEREASTRTASWVFTGLPDRLSPIGCGTVAWGSHIKPAFGRSRKLSPANRREPTEATETISSSGVATITEVRAIEGSVAHDSTRGGGIMDLAYVHAANMCGDYVICAPFFPLSKGSSYPSAHNPRLRCRVVAC